MKKYLKLYSINLLFITLNLALSMLYEMHYANAPMWLHILYMLTIQSAANVILFGFLDRMKE